MAARLTLELRCHVAVEVHVVEICECPSISDTTFGWMSLSREERRGRVPKVVKPHILKAGAGQQRLERPATKVRGVDRPADLG